MFENTNVREITGADFTDDCKLKDDKCTFVLFFADWCGHCQNFKPTYINFANIITFMKVCAVNVDNNKELINKMSKTNFPVKGFPTLLIFKNGKVIEEYRGDRSIKDLCLKATSICNCDCKCEGESCGK